MKRPVQVKDLVREATALAARTRREIEDAGLQVADLVPVARQYGVELVWGELPENEDGSYSKDTRTIILNSRTTVTERINFSFCHEFMHDRLEHDDELLSIFADAFISPSAELETMERLANAGAAELLIPSALVRQLVRAKGFSTALIPELCEQFGASSLAVAFQLINCASHECYLVIAKPEATDLAQHAVPLALFAEPESRDPGQRLVIVYSGSSSSAKYSIRRGQCIPPHHLLFDALRTTDPTVGRARIPFASGNGWEVACDALHFRGQVFAFFNVSVPISTHQLSLF